MLNEVRLTVMTDEAGRQAARRFLMDEDKARAVVHAFEQYEQTGQPEEFMVSYEDSGEGGQMSGLAGETKLSFPSVTEIEIAPDPLGP